MQLVKKKKGFTIVEALVLLFIFSLITMTFYSVMSLGGSYIIESKNHLAAVALANEKMEIIRNLPYDSVGIVGGIPNGNLPAEEDVTTGGKSFHVKNFVQYVDDPFDGTSPTDLDYKRVKVTISWKGVRGATSNVSLITRFVPPGIEQNVSGGTLSINVMGSNGVGVPQASVHITNANVSPAVNLTAMTDDSGNLMLPGAKPSTQTYNIHVSKSGYETVDTIDPATVTYSVIDKPASVVDGMMNPVSIIEDKIANLKIDAVDYLDSPLANTSFHFAGGRVFGYDMLYSPAAPQYNLIVDKTTDATGEVNFSDISPGPYSISAIIPPVGYTLIEPDKFSAFDKSKSIYSLIEAAGNTETVKVRFANNNSNSLLLNVVKDADGTPIVGATVTLTSASGYNNSQITSIDGVVFFPTGSEVFVAGDYNINVTAPNYLDNTSAVTINKLTKTQIKMVTN